MITSAWTTPWQHARAAHLPGRDQVDVWRVRIPHRAQDVDALLPLLSEAERQRMQLKKVEAKRFEYITGQAVLRRVLSHALGIGPKDITYRKGHKGKPYLAASLAHHGLAFNISHSGGEILLALGRDMELGIDLEQINLRTGCERVARRAFSVREQDQLGSRGDGEYRRRFFQMWTCKEAVVKCSGDGIHSGMSRYCVDLDADGSAACISEAQGNQQKVLDYQVVPLPVHQDFAAALVHDGPRREVRLWQIATSELFSAHA